MTNSIQYPMRHHECNGAYIREMELEFKGYRAYSHKHTYPHLSILGRGSVKVTVDGVSTEYHDHAVITIESGKVHEIEALTDDVIWYCVHTMPEGVTVDTIDEVLIKKD